MNEKINNNSKTIHPMFTKFWSLMDLGLVFCFKMKILFLDGTLYIKIFGLKKPFLCDVAET